MILTPMSMSAVGSHWCLVICLSTVLYWLTVWHRDYDPSYMRANAYLDAGTKSGLGVCREKVDNGAGGPAANKCFTHGGGYAGSDDNLQVNEGWALSLTQPRKSLMLESGVNMSMCLMAPKS
jgi:hypothetical protein